MRSLMKVLLPALALVLAVVAGSGPAFAVCGAEPNTFQQYGAACPPSPPGNFGYCYVRSPGLDTLASVDGVFWAFGFGDPADGPGNDSGGWPENEGNYAAGWLRCFTGACASYGKYMTGVWNQDSRIDGCITGNVATGKSSEIMVTLFTDESSDGQTGYFAVGAAARDTTASPTYDYNFGGQHFDLVEIPKLSITGSSCSPSPTDCQTVSLQVTCNAAAGGFYSDGSVTRGEVIQGCEVFSMIQTPRDLGAPDTRAASAWTPTGTVIAEGGSGTVDLSCGTAESDAWIAAGIAFDSGYTTERVSANSTRVECGPNLATPNPKFKLIDRDQQGKGRLHKQ